MGGALRGIWAILLTFVAALAAVVFGTVAYVDGSDPLSPPLSQAVHAVQTAGPRDQSNHDQGDPMSRQVITHVRDQGSP